MRKQKFVQVAARDVAPGAQLIGGQVVEMTARSGNDGTVSLWIDGQTRRMPGDRTLPVVNH